MRCDLFAGNRRTHDLTSIFRNSPIAVNLAQFATASLLVLLE